MLDVISGTKLAKKISEQLKNKVSSLKKLGKRAPCLAVILVGDDPASHVYVSHKQKKCDFIGFKSQQHRLLETTSEAELHELIHKLNNDKEVDGILLQLPLPKSLNGDKAIEQISPQKDVDGLTSTNLGLLFAGVPSFIPCTPKGILSLLKEVNFDLEGKRACVVGRSKLVGLPISLLLSQKNATVTMIHSRTKDPKSITKQADLIVVAAGVQGLVDSSWIKEGATLIDVGIHRNKDGKLVGDVDFDSVKELCQFITPVPGGVGPMTVASLMENTLLAYEKFSLK